jgi:ABC-type cobalt transport system substrate-binding protein
MKISEFKKLEEKIKEQDFNKSFKNINKVMFVLSIFGHFASIFLAYFLLSKILSGAITDNTILVGVSSVILLGGLELLKREIFDKFSLQQIKIKSLFSKDVLPLAIVSLVIVSISFYASIKGAAEFSSKSKEIEKEVTVDIKNYEDSLKALYSTKITEVESQIANNKTKIEDKDKEQTQIESSERLTSQQKNRVKDLKSEKVELKEEIKSFEDKIALLNSELEKEVSDFEQQTKTKGEEKKSENEDNSLFFVIISTLIELVILTGVYFNEYYKFRSYDEFKKKIENDVNFQKWYNYNKVLDIIYNTDTKINDKLPSGKTLQDLCKVNGIILLNKDITDLNKLFNSLGIIKSSGSTKYISKSKENAQEILKNHFNID